MSARIGGIGVAIVLMLSLACCGHTNAEGKSVSAGDASSGGEGGATSGGGGDAMSGTGGGSVGDSSSDAQTAPGDIRIRFAFQGEEAVVKLEENPTSSDLVSMLPLTLTLTDYAQTEKIATLPRKLSTLDAPAGFDPSTGDLNYYAPWGNLALFYKDAGYASGLIPLGRVESGLEKLTTLNGDVTITIERVEGAATGSE